MASSSSRTLCSLLLTIVVVVALQTASVAAAIPTIDWLLPFEGPKTLDANVGDTIDFEWGIGHNVYIHPTMDCNLDDRSYVGDESPTEYTFKDTDGSADGTKMFFSCDIGDGAHCKAGQQLVVTVYSSDSGNTDAAPAMTTETDADAGAGAGAGGTMNEAPMETDVGTPPPAVPEVEVDVDSSSSNCNNNMMILGMMIISSMMMFR